MPPLHGKLFGGQLPGDKFEGQWVGEFVFLPDTSSWKFAFCDERGLWVPQLTGYGDTPRDAFEDCVTKWIYLNAGQESTTLKAILPLLRGCFNDVGGVKWELFLEEVH